MNYAPGEKVVLVAQFNDTSGSAAAATGITFNVYHPNTGVGAPAAYAHGQTAAQLDGKTGCYYIAFALPSYSAEYVGEWTWRVTGACDGQTPAASGAFAYTRYTADELIAAIKSGLATAGGEMDLIDAPNSTAITAIQSGLATAGGEMDLINAPNSTAITAIQSGLATLGAEMDLVPAPNASAILAFKAGLATSTNLAILQTFVSADVVLDTGTTPWSLVWRIKGTENVLMRKSLYQHDDVGVSSIEHIPAKEIEET